jgi:predicted alpha/beta-fold hydrolase
MPGPHIPTLWGKLVRRPAPLPTRTVRVETPDGDFLDLVRLDAAGLGAPHLLLLHGLEGTPRSHYAQGILGEARRRGWNATLLVFRSCGAEMNRLRRSYHSGETGDLQFVFDHIAREHPRSPLLLAGVSLGANVLLKWLGERGRAVPARLRGAAAVSTPFDLARSVRHIDRGFARLYQWHFLRTLRGKAVAKMARFPDLADPVRLRAARTLYEFDDAVTAPVHGFRGADDYYARSSSLAFLETIAAPTLLLSAVDDPFLPAEVLDDVRRAARVNPALNLEFVARGGHVGFVSGRLPWRPFYYAEWRLGEFFTARLSSPADPIHSR